MADWSLAQGNSFGNALATGLQLGQTIRQQRLEGEQRNALMQQQQMTQQRDQQQQQRADLPLVGRLLNSVTDEATYQRARGVAQQYGINLSGAPETYDPQWVEGQKMTVQALANPQAREALSSFGKIATDEGFAPGTPQYQARVSELWKAEQQKYIPFTQGGGVASVTPGQAPQLVIAPNPGGYAAGAPVSGGDIPRLSSPDQVGSLPPGAQFYDPNGVLRQVPGGAGGNASSNFPSGSPLG